MRKSFYVLVVIMAGGCTYFGTSHQKFIEEMDNVVAGKVIGARHDKTGSFFTLDDLESSDMLGVGDTDNLIRVEEFEEDKEKYFYKRPTLWEGRFCYYYIIVEKETRRVIGWGFDYKKGDPKKNC